MSSSPVSSPEDEAAACNLLVSHISFGGANYVQQKREEHKYRIDFAMQRLAKLGQLQ